jgi:hypothetical protein
MGDGGVVDGIGGHAPTLPLLTGADKRRTCEAGRVDSEDPVEDFFAGHPDGRAVAAAIARVVRDIGPHEVRVSRSQVALRRRRGFAYLWRPGQYLSSRVPAVLSIALPREVASERWKEVVHPAERTWMHHLELTTPEEVDAEVAAWLAEAYAAAG